jgi:general stress protein 26
VSDSKRFNLAVTCHAAIVTEQENPPTVSVSSIWNDQDNDWFEVVTESGTYQIIVQDAKAKTE